MAYHATSNRTSTIATSNIQHSITQPVNSWPARSSLSLDAILSSDMKMPSSASRTPSSASSPILAYTSVNPSALIWRSSGYMSPFRGLFLLRVFLGCQAAYCHLCLCFILSCCIPLCSRGREEQVLIPALSSCSLDVGPGLETRTARFPRLYESTKSTLTYNPTPSRIVSFRIFTLSHTSST